MRRDTFLGLGIGLILVALLGIFLYLQTRPAAPEPGTPTAPGPTVEAIPRSQPTPPEQPAPASAGGTGEPADPPADAAPPTLDPSPAGPAGGDAASPATPAAESLVTGGVPSASGARVTGRVVDTRGAEVPGSLVLAVFRRDDGIARSLQCVTDAAGAFAFEALEPARYELRALSNAHIASERHSLDLARDQLVEGLVLVLRDGFDVVGRVVEVGSDQPLAGATISARARRPESRTYGERRTSTGADGAFTLRNLFAATWSLRVKADPTHLPAQAKEKLAEDATPLRFELAPGASLTGNVRGPDGRVLGGVKIRARDAGSRTVRTESAIDGSFQTAALTPGIIHVTAQSADQTLRFDGDVQAASVGPLPYDIVLQELGSIEGVVVDGNGASPGRVVVAVESEGGDVLEADTEDDGSFRVPGLLDGLYRAYAHTLRWLPAETLAVRIEAGRSVSALRLRVGPAACVAGTVRRGGAPDAFVTISLIPVPEGDPEADEQSDGDGSYAVWGLSGGEYVLLARSRHHDELCHQLLHVAPGESLHVDLAMRAAGALEGSVRWQEAAPSEVIARLLPLGDAQRAVIAEDGTFRLTGLFLGSYQVVAVGDGHTGTAQRVLIDGSGTRSLELVFP